MLVRSVIAVQRLTQESKQVLVTPYNSLGGGRYYDVESKSSFAFDHVTQVRTRLIRYDDWNSF